MPAELPAELGEGERASWLPAGALVLATFALGQAVQVANGTLHPAALRWLLVALIAAVGAHFLAGRRAAVAPRRGGALRQVLRAESPWLLVGAVLVLVQLAQLFTSLPGIYLHAQGYRPFVPFWMGLGAAAVLVAASAARRGGVFGRWTVPALVAVYLLLGTWLLSASPRPDIDVFVFQRDGVEALLHGQNPYALRYPNIYADSIFYGEGLVVDGVLQFGFPYPPLSLLLVLPAHVVTGDYRWTQLLAAALAAVLIAWTRPGRWADLAAAMYLFTPRTFFVLEQGWTEPLVVALLAATVFTAERAPRLAPWVLGAFLVLKQYLVFLVPFAWFLLPQQARTRKGWWPWAAKAVGLGAVLSLPMALWDFREFWRDVVALQTYQPFRPEALSFLAWVNQQLGVKPPVLVAFVLAAAVVAFALFRLPRSPAGFAAASALVLLVFFAFNKQAFCNYYSLVIGALALAAATSRPADPASRTTPD